MYCIFSSFMAYYSFIKARFTQFALRNRSFITKCVTHSTIPVRFM